MKMQVAKTLNNKNFTKQKNTKQQIQQEQTK